MIGSHRFAALGSRYATVFLAALVSVLLFAAQLPAQETGKKSQQTKQEKFQQARQDMEKYNQKLSQIRNATLQNNASLRERVQKMKDLQKQKIISLVAENTELSEDATYEEAEAKLNKDKELQKKLRSSFQNEQEFRKKVTELRKDLQKAMQKQNPKTQEYREKRAQAQKTMQMIIQGAQQQRQRQQRGQQGQEGMQKQQQQQ